MGIRVGIDTGGTFTDLVAVDDDGRTFLAKVPSDPADPVATVAAALRGGIDRSGRDRVGRRRNDDRHQRRPHPPRSQGPLPDDQGLRGHSVHPAHQPQAPLRLPLAQADAPRPPARLHRGHGAAGRGRQRARCRSTFRRSTRRSIRSNWTANGVAVAVCLLFSYLNPEHELRVRQAIDARRPGLPVSLSHEVAPIWREYERGTTVTVDAFTKPLFDGYVDGLSRALEEAGAGGSWSLLKSNGGRAVASEARSRPAHLLLSGIAGGGIGGAYVARAAGVDQCARTRHGRNELRRLRDPRGRASLFVRLRARVRLPGQRAERLDEDDWRGRRLDRMGRPRRLPPGRSSRAQAPSRDLPATGAAATEATITDANLVLGRLDPAFFLGGQLPLDRTLASRALGRLGERLEYAELETASAMVRVCNENMANAIRILTVEQGTDPREHSLIAFGGAGPTHACEIAEALDIRHVLVPPAPGLCSAFGALAAGVRIDAVRSVYLTDVERRARPRSRRSSPSSRREARADFAAQGVGEEPSVRRLAAMRYQGQNYEQEVPFSAGELDEDALARLHTSGTAALRGVLRLSPRRDSDRARPAGSHRHGRDAVLSSTARRARAGRRRVRRRERCSSPPPVSSRARIVRREALAAGSRAGRARDRRVHGLDGRGPARLDAPDPRRRNSGGDALMADRPGDADGPRERVRERLPRDGRDDDAHRVLADLQRGPRLLVRAVRPARQHDRAGRVLPGADRRQPVHRPVDAGGARGRRLRARRRRPPQRPVPRRGPHSRAQRDAGRLPRRGALRLRGERRAPRGDRRQGGRLVRRRRHGGLPGGPADPARQDRQARRERHGALAADHGQPPHAAEHVGRPQRADRLAARRGAARAGAARPVRPRSSSSRPPTS